MDQNQRQNQSVQQQLSQPPARQTGRITRGYSDLPKQQPKEVSQEQESQEEIISQSAPKAKKIHHMTLKKLQRQQKLAQMQRLGLIPPKPVLQKLPPRKRGRPKGATKKPAVESQIQSFVEQVQQSAVKNLKKQFTLRKRQNNKNMVQQQSVEDMEEENNQLKAIQIQIQIPKIPSKQISKPQEPLGPVAASSVPPAPKKRGRKKKIQPEAVLNQPVVSQGSTNQKVFTVPKAQTYDNYNKYYKKLLQQTKQSHQKQIPLIFDKFSDPQGYKTILSYVKKDNK